MITRPILALMVAGAFAAQPGCTGGKFLSVPQPEYQSSFQAPAEQVWTIVSNLFDEFPKQKMAPEEKYFETDWIEGFGDNAFGIFQGGFIGGQWKRRAKYLVWVEPISKQESQIRLISRVEEKAPGGPQAYRWQRVASDGKLESELFRRIHEILSQAAR